MPSKKTITADEFKQVKKELQKSQTLHFRVVTGSMLPVIQIDEPITVEKTSEDDLKVFDIVVFFNGQMLVSHYVFHINEYRDSNGRKVFVTRGLKASYEDLPITIDQILGKVQSHRLGFWQKIKCLFG